GSLPLLQFTLEELFKVRAGDTLTLAAYEALGGLEGAVAKRAEETIAGIPVAAQNVLPRVLRSLITVAPDGQAIVTTRQIPQERFPEGSPERRLIDAFVKARLFISDAGEKPATGSCIRVAHEALLSHWGRARDWINERRTDLQIEARIEAAAARWMAAASGD